MIFVLKSWWSNDKYVLDSKLWSSTHSRFRVVSSCFENQYKRSPFGPLLFQKKIYLNKWKTLNLLFIKKEDSDSRHSEKLSPSISSIFNSFLKDFALCKGLFSRKMFVAWNCSQHKAVVFFYFFYAAARSSRLFSQLEVQNFLMSVF